MAEFRTTLSLLFGFLSAFFVIAILQAIGGLLFPVDVADWEDAAAVAEVMKDIPTLALVSVLVSYSVGLVAAGYVSAFFYGSANSQAPLILGIIYTFFGFMNLTFIPHPTWFAVVSSAVYIPSSIYGSRLAYPKKPVSIPRMKTA